MDDIVKEIRDELDKSQELRKRSTLANKVPRIFVVPSVDRVDAFDVEIGGEWAYDRYPREILPAIRAYKSALIKELRQAEYYIQYLQEDGSYPLGDIDINVKYRED